LTHIAPAGEVERFVVRELVVTLRHKAVHLRGPRVHHVFDVRVAVVHEVDEHSRAALLALAHLEAWGFQNVSFLKSNTDFQKKNSTGISIGSLEFTGADPPAEGTPARTTSRTRTRPRRRTAAAPPAAWGFPRPAWPGP
jgi:hypothetical protein